MHAIILWGDEILRFERVKALGLSSRKWVRIDQYGPTCGSSTAGAFTQLKTQNFIAPQYTSPVLTILSCLYLLAFCIAPAVALEGAIAYAKKATARNYHTCVSAREKKNILFIMRTLANTPLLKIKKEPLKKAGEKIEQLHPFKFLECVFTDEELKVCMHNIQGRSWVWREFLRGITDSLAQEAAIGNLLPYRQEFANTIQIDPSLINPSLQGSHWKEFVNILIDKVPRNGDPNHYNM